MNVWCSSTVPPLYTLKLMRHFIPHVYPNSNHSYFPPFFIEKWKKVDHSLENIIYGEKIIVEVLLHVEGFKGIVSYLHNDSYDVFDKVMKEFIVKLLTPPIQNYICLYEFHKNPEKPFNASCTFPGRKHCEYYVA